ncbi:alpha/beta family hydrolase [Frateuria terrea]|uniref:Putative phosphoribosyl transferase n=1 Tax=Frateuria terrea TaxID=529704 RepID=A0A1H6V1G5_9GAMM|nr:alpha/beta family hydrolase [Frateuria terrea]SEI94105.1 putative phosphoribosyl transferase [Frateuria terrea]SFP34292.1 putative phosphoribosyl transferase [Frateuria terrea]
MNVFPTSGSRRYSDRADAARQLAEALAGFRGQRPLVLAIPRGGVPIGRIVADALDGDLDVVLVRKLGSPANCEVAIGAVDEQGRIELNTDCCLNSVGMSYVRAETARQLAIIRKRRAIYSPGRHAASPTGRVVIVVDDGLATGASMRAALEAVRQQRPALLVVAVPVAAPSSLEGLNELADEVVCLHAPAHFRAVGAFYADFQPVDDLDVLRLLSAPPRVAAGLPAPEPVAFMLPDVRLPGDLAVPPHARGLVVFAHGSGSGRQSPRNRSVAQWLQQAGLATLLVDLLTPEEEQSRASVFDIAALADRLAAVVAQVRNDPVLGQLPLGLFGASTGTSAALAVAASRPRDIAAVVSRSGRPDLAGPGTLARVTAPTLLIVGGEDKQIQALNRAAQKRIPGKNELVVVPGATHLFPEPGALDAASKLACDWFGCWLGGAVRAPRRKPAAGRETGRLAS